ncbi:MAG: hypothetical protein HY710_05380 [Candidatus Latescibacteria bacterium]|nr:hypothetical protein [Candidatus Latescibacterota bacterium]
MRLESRTDERRRGCRHGWGGLVLLVFLLSRTVSAADIPKNLAALLKREYRLTRTPRPGETAYYRIRRTDMTMDSGGAITSRMESTGLFSRTVLYIGPAGTWIDRYTWKSFTTGRSEGPADSVRQSEVTAIRGFSYELSPAEIGSLPALRVGGLAKTADTFAFFVAAWDAATFDLPVTPRPSFPFESVRRIGDRVTEVKDNVPADFDFTPIVSNFSYTRRRLSSTFASLSVVGDTPCAVVHFGATDSPLTFDFLTETMAIRFNGTESMTGTAYVSLADGTVVRGEMTTVVVASQTATLSGRTQRVQSPTVVRQHVLLERVTKVEFER